ncbi:MAG TPA: Gfo/Idh/MocA family oxidoreductase [bacterium]|nr:Gfo/Idh/MocA family oxidoreductase [bacterium]
MLKVGIAGFGFMGRMHYRVWDQVEDVRVTTICDANPNIKQEIDKPVGNIPGAAIEIDFDEVALFHDFEKMLAEAEMDALSLTLPTFMHSGTTRQALRAGYHVLCEKPMALNLEECDAMIQAARETGKILQIGQCIRFWPEFTNAKEIIESGEYGSILAASFRRLGAPPAWGEDNWFENVELSGGLALDLHIHDTDYIHHLFGMPEAVCSGGTLGPQKELLHMGTQYFYPEDIMVSAEGSWIMSDTFGFEMSYHMMLEGATLVFSSAGDPTLRVLPDSGDPFTPDLPDGDGYFWEIDHFAKRVMGEAVPEVTTPEQSRDSVKIILAEKESVKKQEKVVLSD